MKAATQQEQEKKRPRRARLGIPDEGFLKLDQIIGNPHTVPPIPALLPVGESSWWSGVKSGRYPKPVRLSPRSVAWKVRDIRALLEALDQRAAA